MDELELIRQIGSSEGPHEARAKERTLGALRSAVGSSDHHRAAKRPRHVRGWLPALGAVLAIGLVISLMPVLGGRSQNAAASLERMAAIAASQLGASVRPGSYVYTKSIARSLRTVAHITSGQTWAVFATVTREAWIGPDGSGRIIETTTDLSFPSEDDRQAWEASGRPSLTSGGASSDESYRPGQLTFLDLSALPTNDELLRDAIEERRILPGPAGTAETFDILGDLLRETHASPALRASLFRVAAGLSGIEVLGTLEDAIGRQGVVVAYSQGELRRELIFDPATSALLGEQTVRAGSREAVEWAVYLDSGVVPSTSGRPEAR
ncbi:MAG: CU044_5270 family protein [Actinomycetota bacterium]